MAFEPFTKDEQPTMDNFNEKLQEIFSFAQATADSAAKIETGEYKGTGNVGESAPTTLSFEYNHELLIIYLTSTQASNASPITAGYVGKWGTNFIIFPKAASVAYNANSKTIGTLYYSLSGNEFSCYQSALGATADLQYNYLDTTYHYIAI